MAIPATKMQSMATICLLFILPPCEGNRITALERRHLAGWEGRHLAALHRSAAAGSRRSSRLEGGAPVRSAWLRLRHSHEVEILKVETEVDRGRDRFESQVA